MGSPKALLPMAGGRLLAAHQAALLRAGGCAEVVIVLGAGAEQIMKCLPACRVVINRRWQEGRFTSILAGLAAQPEADGWLILPVDTVGVAAATLRQCLQQAESKRPQVLRPTYQGQPGKVLWLAQGMAPILQELPADTRLDQAIRPFALPLDVDDPSILNNVNTPAEWSLFCQKPCKTFQE